MSQIPVIGGSSSHPQGLLYSEWSSAGQGGIQGKTAFLVCTPLGTRLRAEVVASVCCGDTSLRVGLKMSLSICSSFGSRLALYSQGTSLCLSRKMKGRASYLLSTWLMPLKIFPSCKCFIVLLRKKPCAWGIRSLQLRTRTPQTSASTRDQVH